MKYINIKYIPVHNGDNLKFFVRIIPYWLLQSAFKFYPIFRTVYQDDVWRFQNSKFLRKRRWKIEISNDETNNRNFYGREKKISYKNE